MAFAAFYGSTAPSEFKDMEPAETERFIRALGKLRQAEREFQVTLAKFQMGASMQRNLPEVR